MTAQHIIQHIRMNEGVSQKDIADRIGVTQQAVSAVERGLSDMPFSQANAALQSFGYKITITKT